MKTGSLQIVILLLFLSEASAQIFSLNHDLTHLYQNQNSQKGQTHQLFLIQLYKQYREYLVYKNAPYKGFTFDLKGRIAQNRLWNQAQFGIGAFTWDFKDPANRKVSGVLFDKPIYLGWDFMLYNQLNFSVGTTVFEQRIQDNQINKTHLFNSFLGWRGKFKIGTSK